MYKPYNNQGCFVLLYVYEIFGHSLHHYIRVVSLKVNEAKSIQNTLYNYILRQKPENTPIFFGDNMHVNVKV